MTHVTSLQIRPWSTLEKPWRFQELSDAMWFSKVIGRPFYAAIVGDTSRYQIWPGGRVHEYREQILKQMADRKARHRKEKRALPPPEVPA